MSGYVILWCLMSLGCQRNYPYTVYASLHRCEQAIRRHFPRADYPNYHFDAQGRFVVAGGSVWYECTKRSTAPNT